AISRNAELSGARQETAGRSSQSRGRTPEGKGETSRAESRGRSEPHPGSCGGGRRRAIRLALKRATMRLLPAIVFTTAIAAAQSNRPELLKVSAVRHWTLPGATRVVIEVAGDFKYRSERLHNPERIFFDILQSRPAISSRTFLNRELEGTLLKKIRVAENMP